MTIDERARMARDELFVRYDKLNALWTRAEEQLTKFHIPKPVKFVFNSYGIDWRCPDDPRVCECLGLQKLKGKWRLCYGSYYDHSQAPTEEPDWTPIIECSAEDRIAAARHLPAFRLKVVESAEKFIPKVEEAIKSLTDALGTDMADLLAERAKLNGRAP